VRIDVRFGWADVAGCWFVVNQTDVCRLFCVAALAGQSFLARSAAKKDMVGHAAWPRIGAAAVAFLVSINTGSACNLWACPLRCRWRLRWAILLIRYETSLGAVKDSSNLIPGHGGLWNRCRRHCWAQPLFLLIIGPIPDYYSPR